MLKMYFLGIVIATVFFNVAKADYCGCKSLRPCYKRMLDALLVDDEEPCVENVAIGSSTVTIFLKALKTYCGYTVQVHDNFTTRENRNLFEVVINGTKPKGREKESRPIILLDAGQDAGSEPVAFALYVIEQLVACADNINMIRNVKWVILPSTNPDGLEYRRNKKEYWRKNMNYLQNKTYGVDITRNFDDSWNVCPITENIFSQTYQGQVNSENETKFIINVLKRYKNDINTYISLRRDGHGIFYPYAARNITFNSIEKVKKRAGDIAAKVNHRAGGFQWFVNESIYNANEVAHCGHSIDYAVNKMGIPYSYEMRIFSENTNKFIINFQSLPKGHEVSLRAGYFSGIREIYNSIVNEIKQKKKLK